MRAEGGIGAQVQRLRMGERSLLSGKIRGRSIVPADAAGPLYTQVAAGSSPAPPIF
jgi:hypothetical protein